MSAWIQKHGIKKTTLNDADSESVWFYHGFNSDIHTKFLFILETPFFYIFVPPKCQIVQHKIADLCEQNQW